MDVRGIDNLRVKAQQYNSSVREDIAVSAPEESQENVKLIAKQDVDKGDEQPLSEKEQQRRMARLQDTLKNHNIEISYNDEVNRYSIKVLDSESQEVVKRCSTWGHESLPHDRRKGVASAVKEKI